MSLHRWVLRIGGVAAAFLPSRHWDRIEARLPVASSAALSGILTFFVGAIWAVFGFLAFADVSASRLNDAVLDVAARQVAHPVAGQDEISSTTAVGLNMLAPFAFLFFTPLGWLTGYLTVSGAARALAGTLGDPVGDPLLTGGDALAYWALVTQGRRSRERRRRRLEGPEIPDRVVSGRAAGIPGADLVVVSCRAKDGWTPGTVLMTEERWYRLGAPVERTVEGHLRTLYPLTEHNDLEVARRTIRYDLGARSRDSSGEL